MANRLEELKLSYTNRGNSKIELSENDFEDTRRAAVLESSVDRFDDEERFSFEVVGGYVSVIKKK